LCQIWHRKKLTQANNYKALQVFSVKSSIIIRKVSDFSLVKRIRKCLILDDDFGYGRKRVQVIDTETGEMYAEDWKNKPEQGIFPEGVNATKAHTIFTREFAPDKQSEYIHVRDGDIEHEYYGFWNQSKGNKGPKKKRSTGNKPGYVKLFNEKFSKLTKTLSDSEMGFLIKLSPLVDWDNGAIVDTRNHEKMCIEELADVIGASKRDTYRKVNSLVSAGVMYRKGDYYYINRAYMAKG